MKQTTRTNAVAGRRYAALAQLALIGLATAPALTGPWHDVYAGDYSTPPNARHGCMLPITTTQYETLLAAFAE